MRKEYVQLVKTYLKRKPDYASDLKQIRTNAISLGATNEEFDQAIREIEKAKQQEQITLGSFTIPQVNYPGAQMQKSLGSRFSHMHFATIVIFAGIIFLLIGIYFISSVGKKQLITTARTADEKIP